MKIIKNKGFKTFYKEYYSIFCFNDNKFDSCNKTKRNKGKYNKIEILNKMKKKSKIKRLNIS